MVMLKKSSSQLVLLLQVLIILIFNLTALAKSAESPPKVLAVYDIRGYEVPEVLAIALTERVHDEVFQRDMYRLVARSDMTEVFKEQGFQLTGACDDASCLVEIGKVLGAELIIGGSVSQVGDYYTVTIRIVDVATGEVVNSVSSSEYFSSERLLNKGVRRLVDQLLNSKRRNQLLTSPYFWGGAAAAVGAGTAVYLQMTKDDNNGPENGHAQIIVTFP